MFFIFSQPNNFNGSPHMNRKRSKKVIIFSTTEIRVITVRRAKLKYLEILYDLIIMIVSS